MTEDGMTTGPVRSLLFHAMPRLAGFHLAPPNLAGPRQNYFSRWLRSCNVQRFGECRDVDRRHR